MEIPAIEVVDNPIGNLRKTVGTFRFYTYCEGKEVWLAPNIKFIIIRRHPICNKYQILSLYGLSWIRANILNIAIVSVY